MTREADHPEMFGEFSKWVRARPELPSANFAGGGYTYNDIDVVWNNYRLRKLALFETKCRGADMTNYSQISTYELIDRALEIGMQKLGYDYLGMHLLQFTGLGPKDGQIFLTRKGAHPGQMRELNEKGLVETLRTFNLVD